MQRKSGLGRGLDALFNDNASDEKLAVSLKLTEIEPNRLQPRKDFDEKAIEELSDSIAEYGGLQPLLKLGGGYEIIAGERRWRASRLAGLESVPAIIREINDTEILELALVENLQREDLNAVEEAEGYKMLVDTYGLTQEEVSERVGKSRSAIANTVRLLSLPQDILKLVRTGNISSGHARAILSIESPEAKKLAALKAAEGASVRELEKMAKQAKTTPKKPSETKKDTFYSEVELALTEALGRKIKITPAKNKGILEIEFYGKDDLTQLANILGKEE